jgi:N-acetylmuramoyl-L-alanine amidase
VERWLFRYAIALTAVGVLAAALVGDRPGRAISRAADAVTSSAPTTTTTTTTTTVPSIFPRLARTDAVPAIRTRTELLLPVTGGSPGAWQVVTPCANTAVTDGEPVRGAHLVLDPGHGGSEPGAVGPSGLVEADLNLDVAKRAARKLRALGATVVLTRKTDVRLTLQSRAAIVTALRPMAFVSIHHNAAPIGRSDRPGSELYHQLESAESKRLAGLLWEEYQEELSPFGNDWAIGDQPGARARQSIETGEDFYGMLRRTKGVPAVLSEAAYLSNPAEDALLNTEAFREAEAKAITDAFVRLVTTDEPGSGYVPTKVAPTPAGGGGGTAGCVDPPLA